MVDVRFSCMIMSDINGVLQSVREVLRIVCGTNLFLAEVNIEDRADKRRLSNAGLDSYEQITEGENGITDISDEDDAEST